MTVNCTPEQAAALVRPRDTIGFGLGPGNPDAFLTALGGREDWGHLVLGGALPLGYYQVLTEPGVFYRSGFFGPAERILLAEGHEIELVPGGFRQFAPILSRFAPRIMATVTVGGTMRSRILPLLPEGSVVSTPRHHTGVVVTEYGSAELTGLTVRERARALADIAHPDFRDNLHAVAEMLGRQ